MSITKENIWSFHITTFTSRTVNQAEISVHEVLQMNGHHMFLSYNLKLQQGAAKEEYNSNRSPVLILVYV